ncbi:N-acetylglucosamine kinase [Actinomyces minihominis]|uniref:N-acetylglucosamine kinase n=1 Tax=Actinomyces minihominis TaxID=2002838 RepID=UPI000C07675D|nr:BadF/BadG/BcrA/BcrD ATPase family protein [Actinomyces minihominis]
MTDSSSPSGPLIVGIDGGGTSVRVAIADLEGTVIAEAEGPGINPNSGGDPRAIGQTLRRALSMAPAGAPARIVGGVAGLAGFLSRPEPLRTATLEAWSDSGLAGEVTVVSDLVVAFWSGVAWVEEPGAQTSGGAVLIGGTGAVAALIEGAQQIALADGYGYLLGDRGAGVWLGIEVVRAALDGASGRGPQTLLTDLVLKGRDRTQLIAEVYGQAPREIGSYAKLLAGAVEAEDAVAVAIVDRAVSELIDTIDSLPQTDTTRPLVLVGGVAAGDNPVGEGLRNRLEEEGRSYRLGGSGLRGALTLAARSL